MNIQITEEMLDAGLDVLGLYDPEWDSAQEVLKNLYRAMRDVEAMHPGPKSQNIPTPDSPHR